MSALPDSAQETSSPAQKPHPPAKPRMSTRNRLLFFVTGWLIVLMPFLFWWNTWFGRQLSDKQLAEYLQDERSPATSSTRWCRSASAWRVMTRRHPLVSRRGAPRAYPVEEVRNTDAWVMGQEAAKTQPAQDSTRRF